MQAMKWKKNLLHVDLLMPINICFVIDTWDRMKPETNSTLRIIQEAVSRGHNVGILFPRNLTVRENVTYGLFSMICPDNKVPEKPTNFYAKAKLEKKRLPVKGFDVIFLRADPPLDWLMLNFLDSVKDDTLIINDIDGLRMANNKLYLTTFEDSSEYIPETFVSKDKDYLYDVITQTKAEKMVLKPLDGFGGSGVIVIEKSATSNVKSLLDFYTGDSNNRKYVILQELVPGAEKGDVRVIMLEGVPLGAYRRVPAEGDNRANISAGGTAVKHVLTKRDKEICAHIGPKLLKDGLFLAGIDIIGDKLIEINVVSPGGIVNINRLNRVRIERAILDSIEAKYRKKEAAFLRKMAFKKEVSGDAN